MTFTNGIGCAVPEEVRPLLSVGKQIVQETTQGSTITGWHIDGRWVIRKSDQQLEDDHREWVAAWEKRKTDRLASVRDDLIRREFLLPKPLQARMAVFHERGGQRFEVDGWEYEMVVAELAAAYAEYYGAAIAGMNFSDTSPDEPPLVTEISDREGTSGNQHGFAFILAQVMARGSDLAGTQSALTALTGSPFYEEESK